jgi:hypothetical protein
MEFPHGKREPDEYGHSPGSGITPMALSRDPLATEGEATPGPDDFNPFEEYETPRPQSSDKTTKEDPTAGDDPFVFDDIADGAVSEPDLPELAPGPDDTLLDLF